MTGCSVDMESIFSKLSTSDIDSTQSFAPMRIPHWYRKTLIHHRLQMKEWNIDNSTAQDEFCVHAIGIPGRLTAENLFANIYGVLPPQIVFKSPGTKIEFFRNCDEHPPFFLRGFRVTHGPKTNTIGIQYEGRLSTLDNKGTLLLQGYLFETYKRRLAEAVVLALCYMPGHGQPLRTTDINVAMAMDILTTNNLLDGATGTVLHFGMKYICEDLSRPRLAFQYAWNLIHGTGREIKDRSLVRIEEYYPCLEGDHHERYLIKGLGSIPAFVSESQLQFFRATGMFATAEEKGYADLLKASLIPEVQGISTRRKKATVSMVGQFKIGAVLTSILGSAPALRDRRPTQNSNCHL
jgi:hypothetical protein